MQEKNVSWLFYLLFGGELTETIIGRGSQKRTPS